MLVNWHPIFENDYAESDAACYDAHLGIRQPPRFKTRCVQGLLKSWVMLSREHSPMK